MDSFIASLVKFAIKVFTNLTVESALYASHPEVCIMKGALNSAASVLSGVAKITTSSLRCNITTLTMTLKFKAPPGNVRAIARELALIMTESTPP